MGYIKHNAIIATSWHDESLESFAALAESSGAQVLGPSDAIMNGFRTVVVCPDGSKEGWEDSDKGDEQREKLVNWLKQPGPADYIEWVEVAYGADDANASVVNSRWHKPTTP